MSVMMRGRRDSVAPAANPWKILAVRCVVKVLVRAAPTLAKASITAAMIKMGRRPIMRARGRNKKLPTPVGMPGQSRVDSCKCGRLTSEKRRPSGQPHDLIRRDALYERHNLVKATLNGNVGACSPGM
jgi:hypothetical protein